LSPKKRKHPTDVFRKDITDDYISVANWGYIVGILHDLGKYKIEFQEKLKGKKTHVDHSTSGALWAMKHIKPLAFAKILAYCIAGHHTGIPDGSSGVDDTCLDRRLANQDNIPTFIPELTVPDLEMPQFLRSAKKFSVEPPTGFSISFFIRMLFSCLKDADCLDTEAFLDPEVSAKRGGYPNLQELKLNFDLYINNRFPKNAESVLGKIRTKIREECLYKAKEAPGLFSLTVPTGGGKTLSSMAFALEHALKHKLERIIYVIPYTSIIEQTAKEFKTIFGDENVIEHHSNFAPPSEDDDYRNEVELRRILATENWDAPIIVTTNVQFFESLFHNKTSRVRKIHNISRSVIVLDEAQMLPVSLLKPTIKAIQELADHFNSTVVLCTATQPALEEGDLQGGLYGVREIIKGNL